MVVEKKGRLATLSCPFKFKAGMNLINELRNIVSSFDNFCQDAFEKWCYLPAPRGAAHWPRIHGCGCRECLLVYQKAPQKRLKRPANKSTTQSRMDRGLFSKITQMPVCQAMKYHASQKLPADCTRHTSHQPEHAP